MQVDPSTAARSASRSAEGASRPRGRSRPPWSGAARRNSPSTSPKVASQADEPAPSSIEEEGARSALAISHDGAGHCTAPRASRACPSRDALRRAPESARRPVRWLPAVGGCSSRQTVTSRGAPATGVVRTCGAWRGGDWPITAAPAGTRSSWANTFGTTSAAHRHRPARECPRRCWPAARTSGGSAAAVFNASTKTPVQGGLEHVPNG